MRQDLSTYDAKVGQHIDIENLCESLRRKVESSSKKLTEFEEVSAPKTSFFMDQIVENIDALNMIQKNRAEGFGRPVVFQEIGIDIDDSAFKVPDDDYLTDQQWRDMHRIDQKTETFFKYFVHD